MIDDLISQLCLAILGKSRKANKYGNGASKELKTKGYQLYLVHPSGQIIEGQ
jgi:predicted CoA-binding protein